MTIYFPLLLAVYYNPFFKNIMFKNIILLLASLSLYAMAEPIYIAFLALSMLFNWGIVHIEYKTKQKFWGNFAIVVDVAVLLFFKYINKVLQLEVFSHTVVATIALPIGLSYFTFREISYVVESRKMNDRCLDTWGGMIPQLLYLCNFITISAGPLGFYDIEIGQFLNRRVNDNLVYIGIKRAVIGLIKKIIIADSLKNLVDICFSQTNLSVFMAWCGAVAYTLEIYYDFSGYSDMAIGIANVFGFKLTENFNLPYTSISICEFWRKWHMSLTKWFTRYIYIPLGGSRVNSKLRHIFNLWVVWLCTGIWHGSNWTFILWSMIYFVLQIIEKYTNISEKINKIHMGHIYTMLVVTLCWVIFRSDDLMASFNYIGAMFGFNSSGIICNGDVDMLKYYLIPMIIGILCSSSIVNKYNRVKKNVMLINVVHYIVIFVVFVITIIIMIGRGYTAPLYAGF
jgi:D-alanyl-lipoteichoic acid acyltransferase DltB (MBOAT superfamily)